MALIYLHSGVGSDMNDLAQLKRLSQIILRHAEDIVLYSVSVENFVIVGCFLHFHEMRDAKEHTPSRRGPTRRPGTYTFP